MRIIYSQGSFSTVILHKMCASKSSFDSNITWCLLKRQQYRLSSKEQRTILKYSVRQATTHMRRAVSCELSGSPVTTFALAFSPDGEKLASSHGDHSLRISEVKSGRCLHVLKGHPRSVWNVVFHPSYPHLVASGCLEGIVKIWDLSQGDGKLIATLNCDKSKKCVASLAFHPTDMVVLAATGNQLLFWAWDQPEPFAMVESNSPEENIRLVKFDSLGHHILTGIRHRKQVPASMDKVDSSTRGDLVVCRRSVVVVNMPDMPMTVDHFTEEAAHRVRYVPVANDASSLFRLQWWDFTNLEIPNLRQRDLNVVACNCRLYNNLSADISEDGCLLSALVVKSEGRIDFCNVCVFSLENHNLGDCLFSIVLDSDTICTSFSPLGTYLVVGIACERRSSMLPGKTMAYIFKICKETNSMVEAATLKLKTAADRHDLKANAVAWHPLIGHGLIAFGTNRGGVYFCHA